MPAPPRNLDLHALECLDVLLRERSVSRAAERLGLSQSSTSEMLARLRERFDDPLLVRGRDGMVPTPRAEALLPDLRRAIDQLRALLDSGPHFDPSQFAARLRITTSDYTQLLLLPELCRRLQHEAPRVALDVVPVHLLRLEAALDAGEVDLAIAFHPEPPPALRRRALFDDGSVVVARLGHPAAAGPLAAEAYAALSHVGVAPSGLSYFSSVIDSALEARGLARQVAVTSPHFLLAALLASQSDLVLTLPRRAGLRLAALLPLVVIDLPLATRPIELAMYWHERTHASPAHQWLREHVREVLAPRAPPA